MVRPITWRNVDAPDFAVASDLLTRAGQQAQSVVSGLQDMVGDVQERRDSNRALQIANNTRDARSALLQQFQNDPLALDEAIRTGAVDQQLQQYGGLVDRNQFTPEALQSLRNNLIESANQRQTFTDQQLRRDQAPIREQIADARIRGDIATVRALTQAHDLGAEYEANALLSASDRERTLSERRRSDQQRDSDQAIRTILNQRISGLQDQVQKRKDTQQEVEDEARNSGLYDYLYGQKDMSALTDQQVKKLGELNARLQEARQPLDFAGFTRETLAATRPYWENSSLSALDVLNNVQQGYATAANIDPVSRSQAEATVAAYKDFEATSPNTFVKDRDMGADAIAELATDKVRERFKWDDGSAEAHIANLLWENIPITTADGQTEEVPITPGVMRAILAKSHEWSLVADSPDDVLDTLKNNTKFTKWLSNQYEEFLSQKQAYDSAQRTLTQNSLTVNAAPGLGSDFDAAAFLTQRNQERERAAQIQRDTNENLRSRGVRTDQTPEQLFRSSRTQDASTGVVAQSSNPVVQRLREDVRESDSLADIRRIQSELRRIPSSRMTEDEFNALTAVLKRRANSLQNNR